MSDFDPADERPAPAIPWLWPDAFHGDDLYIYRHGPVVAVEVNVADSGFAAMTLALPVGAARHLATTLDNRADEIDPPEGD
jgi:hypothetical protein